MARTITRDEVEGWLPSSFLEIWYVVMERRLFQLGRAPAASPPA
jgi:hypothetical protein